MTKQPNLNKLNGTKTRRWLDSLSMRIHFVFKGEGRQVACSFSLMEMTVPTLRINTAKKLKVLKASVR